MQQFPRFRIARRREILGQELELLRQPAADDRVVPVQPQGQRLAIQDFLTNMFIDDAFQLIRRG